MAEPSSKAVEAMREAWDAASVGPSTTWELLGEALAAAYAVDVAPLEARVKELEPVVMRLVSLYRNDPAGVARVCDEELDRSGALLGELRRAARSGGTDG